LSREKLAKLFSEIPLFRKVKKPIPVDGLILHGGVTTEYIPRSISVCIHMDRQGVVKPGLLKPYYVNYQKRFCTCPCLVRFCEWNWHNKRIRSYYWKNSTFPNSQSIFEA
jgi:hypothetical protein